MYVSVGARDSSDKSDYKTKKALRVELEDKLSNVEFYSIEAIGPNVDKAWYADKLDIEVKYFVTGPNPYTSRKWYATVERLPNGRVTVK